ncbi:MAG: L-serine ammonia-lyase, iron-sulfur-dependent, subunit alpha [Oscillospiraceae bacterium]|nr:L-serine ammonia-lyase, iron-sulfur-dependent, subunit alpha [Oscillospiraceae bacterium]
MMFGSVEALLSASAEKPLWQAVLEDDCQDRDADPEASQARMGKLWQTMKQSVLDYDPTRRSPCGLSGGQGATMASQANSICGPFIQEVIATALKMGEQNACMGRIVAAPTAGACGVLPAVLIPLQRKDRLTDEEMVKCLYVAAGFGQVIATRASICLL